MDYIDKLSEEEKAWLNKFTEENLNASFPKGEKHLNKAKKKKNQIYNENNARNRCIYGLAKSSNKLDEINYVEYEELSNSSNPEDAIIEYIDSKKEKED